MTDQQEKVESLVAELKAAAEKATPGHWLNTEVVRPHRTGDMYADSGWSTEFVGYEILGQDDVVVHDATSGVEREEDIEFIALANPANIRTLLSAYQAQAGEIQRLKGWVEAKHLCWELEYSRGAHFVWIVWALKPGVAHVAAICTTEEKANKYMDSLPENGGLSYRGSKMWKEHAPLNHAFGWKDSVAAMVSLSPPATEGGA